MQSIITLFLRARWANTKSNSMQAHFASIVPTIEGALAGKQIQPMLLGAGECLKDEKNRRLAFTGQAPVAFVLYSKIVYNIL